MPRTPCENSLGKSVLGIQNHVLSNLLLRSKDCYYAIWTSKLVWSNLLVYFSMLPQTSKTHFILILQGLLWASSQLLYVRLAHIRKFYAHRLPSTVGFMEMFISDLYLWHYCVSLPMVLFAMARCSFSSYAVADRS